MWKILGTSAFQVCTSVLALEPETVLRLWKSITAYYLDGLSGPVLQYYINSIKYWFLVALRDDIEVSGLS